METLNCIETRRSIRSYENKKIDKKTIERIIESALWAPSAKNRQPWNFCVIQNEELITKISKLSIYGRWMKNAACFIIVFLEKGQENNYIKDIQAVGASIQNILLAAHSLGIGACWIGEILEQESLIKDIISFDNEKYELMAIITLGYPEKSAAVPQKIPLESKIFFWK